MDKIIDKKFYLKLFLITIISVILLTNIFSEKTYRLHAFEFDISYHFRPSGRTIIVLPPIGRISAETHNFPVELMFRLGNIDLNLLHEMVQNSEEFYDFLFQKGRELLLYYILRLSLIVLIGTILILIFTYTKKIKALFLAGIFSLAILFFSFAFTYYTYETEAYQHPEYFGTVEAAPWMIGLIEESLFKIEELSQKLKLMAENVYIVFEKIEGLEPLGLTNGDLIILHVSDIHNNVAAISFIEQMVKNFEVDFIIDTGDLVDYGTPVEVGLIRGIDELGIPYIFIPGNHDSPQVISALHNMDNVIVLDEQVTINGLRIVGIDDPLSKTTEFRSPDPGEIEEYTNRLKEKISNQKEVPHIIAVHNHRIAQAVEGMAALVLHGHTHRKEIYRGEDFLRINAGTTGASGIRSLETTVGTPPYSMVLLRLEEEDDDNYRLLAIDTIEIQDRESGFTLNRHLLNIPLIMEKD
ncbi:metallophosphoesterase family protein [Natronospora cellulosivora (SeqCode)]